MKTVIEIKNVSKKYKITHKTVRYEAMRDIITYAVMNPVGHAKNMFKKILGKDVKEEFWALRDINLTVEKGEVIGIIGKNGAGKSTLLKILTGITPPTTGEITIRGKIASLLEVGTGFHPELTGRENIYLNGAILGMTHKEIDRKFDQIVEFSGIEKFLDTPVKRYSSGMYVRLAFSVAAHMEPDILLVDEVLAVGDSEFQKKCLGKMDEVTRTAGRTILFVSHNMDAIKRLCSKTILLEKGQVKAFGETEKIVELYLNSSNHNAEDVDFPVVDEEIVLRSFSILQDSKPAKSIDGGREFQVKIDFDILKKVQHMRIGIHLKNSVQTLILKSYLQDWRPEAEDMDPGRYGINITLPANLLLPGDYEMEFKAYSFGIKGFFTGKDITKSFNLSSSPEFNEVRSKSGDRGFFILPNKWVLETIKSTK